MACYLAVNTGALIGLKKKNTFLKWSGSYEPISYCKYSLQYSVNSRRQKNFAHVSDQTEARTQHLAAVLVIHFSKELSHAYDCGRHSHQAMIKYHYFHTGMYDCFRLCWYRAPIFCLEIQWFVRDQCELHNVSVRLNMLARLVAYSLSCLSPASPIL